VGGKNIGVMELEGAMHQYEIRILCANRNADAFIEVVHLNDHAAIRAAKKFAGPSQFEVWRGLDCIYDGGQTKSPPKSPSGHPSP
jgi:hypothetical protein